MATSESLTNEQTEALVAAVREHYGLEVRVLSRLGGEVDWNFRAELESGDIVFLRLTPAPIDTAQLEWQDRVLQQLEAHPISVATPKLLQNMGGQRGAMITFPLGDKFHLRASTWLDGITVAELGPTDRGFRLQLGRIAAETIESLRGIAIPEESGVEHHWMVLRAGPSMRATLKGVPDPSRRALILQAIDWFDEVEPLTQRLPRAVVHQDLHDFNLLANRAKDGSAHLIGVVDFNDAVFTARVAELATAATYAGLRQEEPYRAFMEVVEGYLEHAELTDAELDVVYPLGVARLAVNASTWSYLSTGENAQYAEARMAATWPALEKLLACDPILAAAELHALNTATLGRAG